MYGCSPCSSSESRIPPETLNRITDGLPQCVADKVGRQQFKEFLDLHKFQELSTLHFWERCEETVNGAGRLSPTSLKQTRKLEVEFIGLYELTEDVNFDQHQLEILESAAEKDDEARIEAIKQAMSWALNLLEPVYSIFKKEILPPDSGK